MIEQSVPYGESLDNLQQLVYNLDYIPPGFCGIFSGLINFTLIFYCDEFYSLTSEWLINLFYYTSEFSLDKSHITGQLCCEQMAKILSMSAGARLSLMISTNEHLPHIDWMFYLLIGLGSFLSSFAICLTTTTFADHMKLLTGYFETTPHTILSESAKSSWIVLYGSKIFGISTLK